MFLFHKALNKSACWWALVQSVEPGPCLWMLMISKLVLNTEFEPDDDFDSVHNPVNPMLKEFMTQVPLG